MIPVIEKMTMLRKIAEDHLTPVARRLLLGLALLLGLSLALACTAVNLNLPDEGVAALSPLTPPPPISPPPPPPHPPPPHPPPPHPPPPFPPDEAADDGGAVEPAESAAEDVFEVPEEADGSGIPIELNLRLGQAPPLVDKSLRFVRLFYGTNRARTVACAGATSTHWDAAGRCRPNRFYGGFPADATGPVDTPAGAGLEVGTATVTFPADHAAGKIERPPAIFSFDLRDEDPDRDVLISELRPFAGDYEAWVREVRTTGRDQAFIYVHGFETTFDEAARRAAQVAYDLDFDLAEDFRGIPMLFSWPSRGELSAYLADYDTSLEAVDAFNRFLDLVKLEAGVRRVHVIAHSMGNRVVAEALRERGVTPEPILDQLILAAPDIWASRFKARFLHTLPKIASRVTLYVSDQDRALHASSGIRRDEPRAGQVAGGLLEVGSGVAGFEAVNASSLDRDFLGHSYYASNNSMLSDLYCLLKGAPAASRPLLEAAGAAWEFRPLAELASLHAGDCSPPSLPALAGVEAGRTWPYWAGGLLVALVLVALKPWMARRRRAA